MHACKIVGRSMTSSQGCSRCQIQLGSASRQIGALHMDEKGEWVLSQITNKSTHHYNPFLSADGELVGYHRCRCAGSDTLERIPVLEHHSSPLPSKSLIVSSM